MIRLIRAALGVLSLLATGCVDGNSTGGMSLPAVQTVDDPAPSSVSLFPDEAGARFRLERVVAALNHGEVIAHYPNRYWHKWKGSDLCNIDYGDNARLEWGAGPQEFGDWRDGFGKAFFDAMKSRSANVVGDPSGLFGAAERAQTAELLVGARIARIGGNICRMHDYWTARPLGRSYGEFFIHIEWEVFSPVTQRVVYKFATDGYGETREGTKDGALISFSRAFRAAADRAALDPGFRALLTRRQGDAVPARQADTRLTVVGSPLFQRPLGSHVAIATTATVTIEFGNGHGSGFLVSRDGYVLTNAHVVGQSRRVNVVFQSGLRAEGEVLRVARLRDVALVKIPVGASVVLPVRKRDIPAVADEVYVIGAPAETYLRSTVSKGIVSAFRRFDGLNYIQSDAAATHGNSGGPLLDSRGNVVGITVQKHTEAENVNLFIPIAEALAALNVEIVVE